MCHTIQSSSNITLNNNTIFVDSEPCASPQGARDAVFGEGRYTQFVNTLYADLGITTT